MLRSPFNPFVLDATSLRCPDRRHQSGFTLIEMIVVVGIIAIIACFAVPAYQNAIQRARTTVCAENLHRLSVSINLFTSDHGGLLPMGYTADMPDGAIVWTTRMLPYLPQNAGDPNEQNALYCPTTSPTGTGIYKRDAATWMSDYACNGYAFHYSGTAARMDQCSASTIFLYDGGQVGLLGASSEEDRHNNGLNCLFADGHVNYLHALPTDPNYWYLSANLQ